MSIKIQGTAFEGTNKDNGYTLGGEATGGAASQSVFRSVVNAPTGTTIASGKVLSAFQAGSDSLAGTHTGKASVFHVETPTAGAFDSLVILDGYSTGCASLVTITLDSLTVGSIKSLAKIRIGSDDLLIPCLSTITHA
jgi:hypothetical protein